MAGLVGSVMVSYTKARAESIGIECNVGFMERPERMICLIAGALLDVLEPALWVLAVLANVTALQRIVFTRRMTAEKVVAGSRRRRAAPEVLVRDDLRGRACCAAGAARRRRRSRRRPSARGRAPSTRTSTAIVAPLLRELGRDAAFASPIGDHAR